MKFLNERKRDKRQEREREPKSVITITGEVSYMERLFVINIRVSNEWGKFPFSGL